MSSIENIIKSDIDAIENVTTEFDFNHFTDLHRIARICDVRKIYVVYVYTRYIFVIMPQS